jgi:glutamine synthetase
MEIRNIDLKFVDLLGRWHHLTTSSANVGRRLFEEGFGFDGSNFPGFTALAEGDLSLIPDLETGIIEPFRAEPTLSLICKIVEADTKKAFSRDPRTVARRAEEYLKKSKIAESSMWSPEFEYFVFNDIFIDDSSTNLGYEIIPAEGLYQGYFGLHPENGYHAIPPEDTLADLRDRTVTLLENAGVKTVYHHHEVGGHGQLEIEVDFEPMVKTGDNAMTVKYFARMAANQNGQIATFIPKPLFSEPGNGMHFHQFLVKGGKSMFFNPEGYAGLSKMAHQYIAGLLKHAPALLSFTNPSTNSFKRLIPGFEAPVNCFFSLANRSAAIRIPKYATRDDNKRIEFRPSDATCNVYLAMAAQLMAGLDGIRNGLQPSELGYGPYDVNIFEISEEERQKIKPLPSTLLEALHALEKDHDFLTEGGVFDKSLIEAWIKLKRKEAESLQLYPHPIEIQRYLDC